MRIKWRLVDVDDAATASYLNDELLPGASSFWAGALRVMPVAGALRFTPFCNTRWQDPDKTCARAPADDQVGYMPGTFVHIRNTQSYTAYGILEA